MNLVRVKRAQGKFIHVMRSSGLFVVFMKFSLIISIFGKFKQRAIFIYKHNFCEIQLNYPCKVRIREIRVCEISIC